MRLHEMNSKGHRRTLFSLQSCSPPGWSPRLVPLVDCRIPYTHPLIWHLQHPYMPLSTSTSPSCVAYFGASSMEAYYILPEQHCFIQNISTSLHVYIALVLVSFGQLDSLKLYDCQLIAKDHVCQWPCLWEMDFIDQGSEHDVSHYLSLVLAV